MTAEPTDRWTLIGLRSAEQNAALARQARAAGWRFIGLPALILQPVTSPESRAALRDALACPLCLFTSPAAVRFAGRLQRLADYRGSALAVGAGTAAALRRAGVENVAQSLTGMHSEGLLALPALAAPSCVGLVGAAGGRDLLEPTLRQRGADVLRANVYQRRCGRLDRRHQTAIEQARGPLALLVTSAEAFDCAIAALRPELRRRLLDATAIVSSDRLRRHVEQLGCRSIVAAVSPRWPHLLAALREHAKPGAIR